MLNRQTSLWLIALCGGYLSDAHAAPMRAKLNRPFGVGIVLPSVFDATASNPATLVKTSGDKGLRLYGSPPLNGSSAVTFGSDFASANKNFGFGLGYQGSTGVGAMTHRIQAGVGFGLGNLGLGFNASMPLGGLSATPTYALGLVTGNASKGLGVVLGLQSLSLAVGVATGEADKYSFELDAGIASLTSFAANASVNLTAVVKYYLSFIGLMGQLSTNLNLWGAGTPGLSGFSPGGGAIIRLGKGFYVSAIYSGGVTIATSFAF